MSSVPLRLQLRRLALVSRVGLERQGVLRHVAAMKFLVALGLAWAVVWSARSAAVLPLSEKDFKGTGRCLLASHGFVPSPNSERAINDSVQKLIERHQDAFGFKARPDFRLRIRIFGKFQDYTNVALNLYFTNAIERRAYADQMIHVAGFYSPPTREIITWQQEVPGVLGHTLLHEASHAIMDAHYDNIPLWLLEGSAEYFAYTQLSPPDERHLFVLRETWTSLNRWLKEGQLVPFHTLLNADAAAFKQLNQEKAYAESWILFQVLVQSEPNRRAMFGLLRERQDPSGPDLLATEQLARLYPGGLKRLEADWLTRIRAGSSNTNAPDAKFRRVN